MTFRPLMPSIITTSAKPLSRPWAPARICSNIRMRAAKALPGEPDHFLFFREHPSGGADETPCPDSRYRFRGAWQDHPHMARVARVPAPGLPSERNSCPRFARAVGLCHRGKRIRDTWEKRTSFHPLFVSLVSCVSLAIPPAIRLPACRGKVPQGDFRGRLPGIEDDTGPAERRTSS